MKESRTGFYTLGGDGHEKGPLCLWNKVGQGRSPDEGPQPTPAPWSALCPGTGSQQFQDPSQRGHDRLPQPGAVGGLPGTEGRVGGAESGSGKAGPGDRPCPCPGRGRPGRDVRPPRKRLREEVIWGTGVTSEAQVWSRLGAGAGDQVRRTPHPRLRVGSSGAQAEPDLSLPACEGGAARPGRRGGRGRPPPPRSAAPQPWSAGSTQSCPRMAGLPGRARPGGGSLRSSLLAAPFLPVLPLPASCSPPLPSLLQQPCKGKGASPQFGPVTHAPSLPPPPRPPRRCVPGPVRNWAPWGGAEYGSWAQAHWGSLHRCSVRTLGAQPCPGPGNVQVNGVEDPARQNEAEND